jgi:alpha-mannosidase
MSFDIHGYLRRSTHRNTSWKRPEVVGHRYADLFNFAHGVALLNDWATMLKTVCSI